MLRIFDAPEGSILLWITDFPSAVFHDGIFEADLGDITNLFPESLLSKETNYYLEVEINGETQDTRQIISSSEIDQDAQSEHAGAYLQAGAVAFFDLPQCPAGWSELTQARGRYIVGLNPSGIAGAVVGTALSNLENRPVGIHTHTINDPGHSHSCWYTIGCHIVDQNPGDVSGISFTTKCSYS